MKTKPASAPQSFLIAIALVFMFAQAFRSAAQAPAAAPELMTYQGYLVDGSGNPLGATVTGASLPKNYDVVFRIYDAPNGGAVLWGELQTVTVDKGYFSVLLGEGSDVGEPRPPLSSVFSNTGGGERYIAMTVRGIGSGNADVNILPRLRLLASPYAYLAQYAATAGGVVGSNITGTVSDQRLSANVALRAGGNSFTGAQSFTAGNVGIGTGSPGAALHVNSGAAPAMIVEGNSASGTWLSLKHGNNRPWQFMGGVGGGFGLGLGNSSGSMLNALSLDTNGNLGINVASPAARLDVAGVMRVDSTGLGAPVNGVLGGLGSRLVLWPGSSGATPYALGMDSATLWSGVPDSSYFKWYVGTVQQMLLTKSGLALGTSGNSIASNARLQIQNGAIMPSVGAANTAGICWPNDPGGGSGDLAWMRYFVRAGEATTLEIGISNDADDLVDIRSPAGLYVNGTRITAIISDQRLKRDLGRIEAPLEIVLGLDGVTFEYRSDEFIDKGLPKGRQLGFIAQEVKELLPEVVSESTDGYLAVNYSAIVPVLVEAIKQQQAQLTERSGRIAELEDRLSRLEAKFNSALGSK